MGFSSRIEYEFIGRGKDRAATSHWTRKVVISTNAFNTRHPLMSHERIMNECAQNDASVELLHRVRANLAKCTELCITHGGNHPEGVIQ